MKNFARRYNLRKSLFIMLPIILFGIMARARILFPSDVIGTWRSEEGIIIITEFKKGEFHSRVNATSENMRSLEDVNTYGTYRVQGNNIFVTNIKKTQGGLPYQPDTASEHNPDLYNIPFHFNVSYHLLGRMVYVETLDDDSNFPNIPEHGIMKMIR